MQRLGRQTTELNIIQSLLQQGQGARAHTVLWDSIQAAIPWNDGKITTYILEPRANKNGLGTQHSTANGRNGKSETNHHEHQFNHAGFIQIQKRSGRPESDLLLIAPALDKPWGHPSIWEKLIAYTSQEAAKQGILRLYADLPDQPLPVQTFAQNGFIRYSRQTIWRLPVSRIEPLLSQFEIDESTISPAIRGLQKSDEWGLRRLYSQVTPVPVQQAEGSQGGTSSTHDRLKPPILEWVYAGSCRTYVLTSLSAHNNSPNTKQNNRSHHYGRNNKTSETRHNTLHGAIQIASAARGIWLRLWVDTHNPDTTAIHELLRYALWSAKQQRLYQPFNATSFDGSRSQSLYMGVADYQGGLSSILDEYGFAPFTDRARLVKHVVQGVRVLQRATVPVLQPAAEAIPTPYSVPQGGSRISQQ
ncbi:MAG: hypothetical protein AAF639_02750 [Chloroflexota bacterium]